MVTELNYWQSYCLAHNVVILNNFGLKVNHQETDLLEDAK